MPISVTIPLVTLSANQVINASATAVPVGATAIQFLINRNVGTHSLDTNPTGSLSFQAEISLDGGTTWELQMGAGTLGGIVKDKGGNTIEVSSVGTNLFGDPNSTQRQIRGSVTNGPVVLSVSGSLNVT